MSGSSRVERLGNDKSGKLLLEMSSQTTLSLVVYAIYSITDTYFLSVGINSLAAAGAAITAPVLIGLGAVATTVGAGGARLFSLTGIWVSEASSELLLCVVAVIMLKRFGGKTSALWQHEQPQQLIDYSGLQND